MRAWYERTGDDTGRILAIEGAAEAVQ